MTMLPSLIPAELLARSNRILFITHLALGDFTYMQNYFNAFARAYPHLKIDLWVDEVRRTDDQSKWPFLKKYALYDWVDACPFFNTIYKQTYSPALFEQSIQQAQAVEYPIVVALTPIRPHFYASLARQLSPHGFIAGIKDKPSLLRLHHQLAYRKLDIAIPRFVPPKDKQHHISDVYAHWFQSLFGLEVPQEQRFPFVDIPAVWQQYAKDKRTAWCGNTYHKLVFINPFAKTKKRCWPLERVVELIHNMQQQEKWKDTCFVVNAAPQDLEHTRDFITSKVSGNVQMFSAVDNFFELPAVLAECDLIISVETAVMHLANAVHVPVIALMRQKTPEWVPIDAENSTVIMTERRRDWVKEISIKEIETILHLLASK